MKLIDTKCPHCGSSLKVDSTIKNATCEYCGSTFLIDDEVQHIKYDNAEEAGYNFEKDVFAHKPKLFQTFEPLNQPHRFKSLRRKERHGFGYWDGSAFSRCL